MIKRFKLYLRTLTFIKEKKAFCIKILLGPFYILTYNKNLSKWIMHYKYTDINTNTDWRDPYCENEIKAWIHNLFVYNSRDIILISSSRRHFSVNVFDVIKVGKRIEAENRNHLKSVFFNETE